MSTNYYATTQSETGMAVEVGIKFHIGKLGGRSAIVSGDWFESFADWMKFLRYNAGRLDVVSESGEYISVDELEKRFMDCDAETRAWQYNWLVENQPDRVDGANWLDPEGFTMSRGWFC